LAALIPEELGVELVLIDESIESIPDELEADIIGMTVITGTAKRSYELAIQFRSRGKFVVLGGPHITLMPWEARAFADVLFVGYAEQTWPQFLYDFAQGKHQKLYEQSQSFNLDNPVFPKRELFSKSHFLTQAVFEATRSCIHHCEFCVVPSAWGSKQYQKPIDFVIEDIKRVGQRRIIFVDLNLVANKRYAMELFTRMIPLNIQWFGLSTVVGANDDELLELMARSGCKGLLLGLESISDASLKDVRKQFNSSVNYRTLIDKLHRLKISIQGCFVFGLEHDTLETFDETIDFVLDTGIDLPRFAILTPFPGTPLYQSLESQGRILTKNWELYDVQHAVFQPNNMTAEELSAGHKRVWREVYSYPSIAKRLWRAKNFQALALTSNLGYRFYGKHLDSYYNCDWQVESLLPNPMGQFSQDRGSN
jgi:radical SAM superfamily enzyme YgiQ (UPF0313 family)